MKIKLMHILGCLAIVGVIGVGIWVMRQPRGIEPVVIYKVTVPEPRPAKAADTSNMTLTQKMVVENTRDVNDVQWAIDKALENLDQYGPEGAPRREAFKKAILSPAFVEYQKKENANYPSFDLTLWWDFLESQGLSSGRMAQEANFRNFFPTGEYADYEPMMRKKLAEIFLEMASPDSTSDDDIVRHTVAGMMEFRKDYANLTWMRGQFNGYNGDLDWADNIRQNAATIVANATSPQETLEAPSIETEFFTQPTQNDFVEENVEIQPLPTAAAKEIPARENLETLPLTDEEIEAEPMKYLGDIPKLPTEESIETTIKEHFSPQRFSTAMQTLNQYGPKEGLRRLKESDPEVAAHLEHLVQPNKEND
ncbi:hypothetical protein F4054_15520 [Candidatus Poribacteria bacterium]|nr:hypothetical protein [Candidatus Poribacteria bacterium]MYG08720.1 hypothetical protein [Candidatus Poribacteria bacterium]MYK23651.1 hypothetical protein [Candidatus Poribacteria bacterium]